MKTFTTYAEKKAKQILNLLQGYTKGIRMTAILILLLMGVGNMSAATITSDGTARLYFNMKAVSWWIVSSNDGANYAYFFNSSTNAWSTKATQYSEDTYYVTIPKGSWTTVILTRNSKSGPGWNDKLYNQTGDITLSSTSNYISKFSESSTSVTWGTAVKPASTGSLSASSTSVNIGANVTLTPSLTSNQTINDIKFTTYSISPNSGASTSNNTFTATKSGTYTVTATITYNPDGYTSLTSEVSPTVTITVNPWTITWNPNGGSVTPTSSTYDGATAVSLPTPTRTGYNFDGWYTAASGGTKINDIGTTTKPTNNVTYYAHWTPKNYTITLNANGGASNGSATATYNSSTITNLTHPTRTDYRCNGYYTATSGGMLVLNIDGTLAKNVSGYTDANGNWTIDGTATLYAQWTYDVTEYTVTFGAGTGFTSYGSVTAYNNTTSASITSPTQVRSGQSITFTATPETGYEVEGWYTNAACTEGKHDAGNTTYTTSITGNTNVYVKFVEKTWSVAFTAGTGGTVTTPASTPQTVGQVTGISINANPDNGYTFNKWTITSGNGTLTNANSVSTTFKPTSDATVEASFNETLSTLTTSNNYTEGDPGYKVPEASVSKIGVATTAQVTATTPSGAYAFTGWTLTNCERTDTGDATALSITVRSMGDGAAATVTANYEKIPSKTVYFKPKTEWKNNNPVIICDGATPLTPYDCDGEYYTAEVPGGTTNLQFGDNNETTLSLTIPQDDKVLYDMTSTNITKLYLKPNANWKQANARFAAYFFGNGDKWVSMTAVADQTDLYEVDIPTDKSYPSVIFCRMNPSSTTNGWTAETQLWNQTSDLTIPTDGKNQYTVEEGAWSKVNGSWHKVWDNSCWKEFTTPTYQITLKQITGGTISVSNSSGISLNEQVTVTMTASTGYTFKSGTITIGTQSAKTITNPTSTHTICGDATITAEWKPDTHTVTFDANGHGTAPDAQNVDYNEKVTKPDDLTATGYTFDGWYKEENCTNVWDFNNDVVTADITLYAKWTAIKYNIEYTELYDVTHNNPTEYTIESETITFAAPTSTRNGYTFAGWNPAKIEKGSTGDKKVTAQWTEILSTITIKRNPAEGGNIEVDGQPFTPGNTVQVGVATFKRVTAVPNEGYGVAQWGIKGSATFGGGSTTFILYGNGTDAAGELIANFIGKEYTITFDHQDGTDGTEKATVNYKNNNYSVTPVIAPTRTGYSFGGYYTEANGAGVQVVSAEGAWLSNATGYTDADGKWLVHENTTLYAKWIGNTYTVTLQHSTIAGCGSGGTSSVTATYNAAMPTATMPTAANGYVFMGYFDGEQGAGTQYYNADGTSAHIWDKADNATLYAHFVKAEITQITLDKYTFEPVEAGGTGFVTATPTIEPTPTNAVVLCWRLLYNNGNEVPEHSAQVVSGNIVKFSIAGLAAGTYKIEAVLRTGNNCGSGEELSTKTINFTIASNYTITVKYTCDGKDIMAASKVSAHVTEETEITAPDITGYTFSSWEAGDGVTIKSTNGNSVKITAIYDGYLTAKYTARPMVYFKNTLGWEKVYVYTFWDNAWWDSGSQGVHPGAHKLEQGEMTLVEGTTDIYYFELSNPDSDYTQDNNANHNYIAFSNKDMSTYDAFYDAEAIYRGDHKNNLTLFIPQTDQTPSTTNQTKYYNKGIWMKYNSTESGYQMPTNNSVNDNPPGLGTDDGQGWGTYGNKFTAQTPGGYKFSITKHLEANKTYEFKIKNYVYVKDWENKDNNEWYGYNENSNTITDSKCTELHFHEESDKKHDCGNAKIKTTAEGEYTFTIDLSQGKVLLSVEYPVQKGDYRVIYKDNATWSHASAHDANWYHPSRVIKKNKTSEAKLDTISFFLHRETGSTYSMKFQKCTNISAAGKVTWTDYDDIPNLKDKGESGVYNFIVEQTANGESISCTDNVERYTGNYYIRVDALAGKWDNYKTTPENRMTYSAFSESEANSFGDKYSHYATKYCDEGTNIKFVIANDYSPCISDTLAQDVKVNGANPFDNLDEHGTIKSDYQQNKANVRFMWNRKTNKISRVYIGSAAEAGRHFLVLKSDKEMKGEDGKDLQNEGDNHEKHKAVFKDTQNWMYERTIKVQPDTRVKLYACYPMDNISVDAAEQKAQHFHGAYDGDTWDEENSIVILGGSGTDWNKIRVIYDFKTNRLMAALVPDQEVSGEKTIAADVMIIRQHQNPATSITLANDDSKMKEVKTVYGSLQLNRWVLNNRKSDKSGIEYCTEKINNQDTYSESKTNEHHPVLSTGEQKSIYERALYFISFPFDVHLSDVFGFGTYGTHWVISEYNGLRRAQRGYFAEDCINEDCTNWDYIWDRDDFVMKANEGYLLSLDIDLMKYDNTDFWKHNIEQVELFFPSTANLQTIERTSYTMPALGDDYQCKINLNTDGSAPDRDRRVKDSYWRCIGVPSFADYDGSLYKSEEDAESDKYPINWNTDYTWKADESGFPFLYEWNVTDNSLSVQNTSKYQFKPTFAYLVQNGGAIYWKAVNSKPSSVIARQRTEADRNYEWKIALMRDGNQEDQTFVRITDNENVTTAFDFNQDLAKEFNYGRGDIYTLIGYERVAANSMPFSDKATIIPLGLNIEQAGDYTIAMPEGVENIGITLVDNETGIHTNLSAGQEYTITLNKGICENRLFIEVSPIQQSTTDLEYTTEDTREQATRKMLIDGILYLIRDGVIYDAQGHRL